MYEPNRFLRTRSTFDEFADVHKAFVKRMVMDSIVI